MTTLHTRITIKEMNATVCVVALVVISRHGRLINDITLNTVIATNVM